MRFQEEEYETDPDVEFEPEPETGDSMPQEFLGWKVNERKDVAQAWDDASYGDSFWMSCAAQFGTIVLHPPTNDQSSAKSDNEQNTFENDVR